MTAADEHSLLARLRAGEEAAFSVLVERYHPTLVRLAQSYVGSRAVAEEVAQDAWLGFLRGLDRFEGRSSLQTWLYRILVNRARTTGAREHRHVSLPDEDIEVEAGRFTPDGRWADPPVHWADEVDDRLAAGALRERLRELIDALPPAQCRVLILRDVHQLTSAEVCEMLNVSEGNQRVLLHRARTRLRRALEEDAL